MYLLHPLLLVIDLELGGRDALRGRGTASPEGITDVGTGGDGDLFLGHDDGVSYA